MSKRIYLLSISISLLSLSALAQNLTTPFKNCNLTGSITIYDYKKGKWLTNDEGDSRRQTQPASTFKIINLLIALQTGVIKDENEIVKWPGSTDTTLYGYRPEIYKDISVKEAFEVSAGWAFIELAKKVGRKQYLHYLKAARYGNNNLSEKGDDFWNFGAFGVSPRNQITFLTAVYDGKTPFSKRNLDILKKVMVNEQTDDYTLRAKTGWTRVDGNDIGWWVGYVEREDNVYFFATRVTKKRSTLNADFGNCRKMITKAVLKEIGAM
ncbi:penicillin-binding transpeptidase domain-containing protein [Dyadobacter aurulentus]|uniref:penicillin-binding transpeptidase domain-containing protein n=1 Tax=Dyadobacter sp. UC 10 TaxID=2605428 RepID=UPI0011F0B6B4|nr:penicillin-binding transpeptidase domain-containing protein [Dyadobacter sp. UC 10]KAA0989709.1 class D beta-lactamase [Dyadobacter sp. UC 10]